ncbi:MAG: Dihydroanticapsin 7-dehydrogenase [Alphaproteobacteria bacterium MarineAlpha5_Bin9]|nr:MAG: Dihydroanticapsin 7-dehydrogenase [Alphaproteobacteria bacterium MarineAlpha5_Bin9]
MKSRWNEKKSQLFIKKYLSKGINRDLALRIYSSRLLGQEPKLVLHGGGNTSVKIIQKDSFKKKSNILFVKGSGKNMKDIGIEGFPALELDNLINLKKLNKINDYQMINFQKKFMVDTNFPNSSVETLLHAFLPHKYIDHTHSNAILSIINQENDYDICKKVFGNELAIVPYIMPGFMLAKKATQIYDKNPKVKGLILLKHGIFTFGKTAKESYKRMIRYVNIAENELRKKNKIKKFFFKNQSISTDLLISILRKNLTLKNNKYFDKKIIIFSKINFVNDLFNYQNKIKGPITPDHVIRIKSKPLFIDLDKIDYKKVEDFINKKILNYSKNYFKYFKRNKHLNKNAIMHDPLPRLIIIKGIGLFSIGKNYKDAKIIMDIGKSSLSVINDAYKYGKFKSISEKEIFKMEYWPLELAKLKPSKSTLQGHVTVISGGLGTIGYATALKFKNEGSEVVIIDRQKLNKEIDGITYFKCDVSDELDIKKAFKKILHKFGGIDIVISNAGFAIQKPLSQLNKNLLDKSFSTNFYAHHFLTQQSTKIFKKQATGGCVLFNISKQAINPGKNFGAYGMPKATLLSLMKQYALEFSKYDIRFNGVNADRIRSGLLTKELISKRAKIRGLSVDNYMQGNLLNKEVKPEDVANSFFHLSISTKTTACIITVDGGNIEASLR